MSDLVYKGLTYRWSSSSFLTERQASYALAQLWRLVAGDAEWTWQPGLTILAIDRPQLDEMFGLSAGTMPWVSINSYLPAGYVHKLDTEKLPAVCRVSGVPDGFDGSTAFGIDLVAATFLLLTRWEEWKWPELDEFGCHREDASLAAKQSFRDRPILDEWAMVLRVWLKRHRPIWEEAMQPYAVEFSHDIDVLRYYKHPGRIIRGVVRKAVKERMGLHALKGLHEGMAALFNPSIDPCSTALDKLMTFSEDLGTRSTFFFMSAKPGKYDDGYSVQSSHFLAIRDQILDRGHQLGWHPGFEAAENDQIFHSELSRIRRVVPNPNFGVRHHFLRWRAGTSWKRLASSDISYDASVGYNYCLGFRASTSHRYMAYDLEADRPLSLEVRPLIVMDGPLQGTHAAVEQTIALYARRCGAVSGRLTILIHNYSLMRAPDLLMAIKSGLTLA